MANPVYDYLNTHGPCTRQQLAEGLGLSMPTLLEQLKPLWEKNLVESVKRLASTGGRPAETIGCNRNAKYAVGLDVTLYHLGGVVVDLSGSVIKHQYTNLSFSNTTSYFQQAAELVRGLLADGRVPLEKVLGVGVSVPGKLSKDSRTLEFSPVLDFQNGKAQDFGAFLPLPYRLCNDARASGWAEYWNGGHPSGDLVYLSLNRMVDGAVFRQGELVEGQNNRSGSFGHMILTPGGKRCKVCGMRGCMNAYCSIQVLADSAGGRLDNFFINLERGNLKHQEIWRKYVDHLAQGISNLRMAFDCDVMLGGHLGTYLDDHLEELRKAVSWRDPFGEKGEYLKISSYKLGGAAVGAALSYVRDFLANLEW